MQLLYHREAPGRIPDPHTLLISADASSLLVGGHSKTWDRKKENARAIISESLASVGDRGGKDNKSWYLMGTKGAATFELYFIFH
jgi:hypothetical protein